jgi:hypothetical protein
MRRVCAVEQRVSSLNCSEVSSCPHATSKRKGKSDTNSHVSLTILIFRLTFNEFCESCNCRQWPWTPLATRKCDRAMKPGKLHTTPREALVGCFRTPDTPLASHRRLLEATCIIPSVHENGSVCSLFMSNRMWLYWVPFIIKLCSFAETNKFRITSYSAQKFLILHDAFQVKMLNSSQYSACQ